MMIYKVKHVFLSSLIIWIFFKNEISVQTLVGMKNSAAAMENNVNASQKIKNKATILPAPS